MSASSQYSYAYQLAILIREHPMFTLQNVKDHLGKSWTSNRLNSNVVNLRDSHGWEIEYNRVLNVWHVLGEGSMPMPHTLSNRIRNLLADKPEGMDGDLLKKELNCTDQQLKYTRNFFNRKEGGPYRLRKVRKQNIYYLEKKDECI